MQQIVAEVENHMRKCGGTYSQWYAGIASEPKDRLFSDHSVRPNDAWIYRDCGNDTQARVVENYFLSRGCQGGDGGGDQSTKFFYAYRVQPHTREGQ